MDVEKHISVLGGDYISIVGCFNRIMIHGGVFGIYRATLLVAYVAEKRGISNDFK